MTDGLKQTHSGSPGFDGIICIGGEDWWYHNRGHFDFQIMRRLARTMPVLFVNSLGVRMPKLAERRLFVTRMARKLKSLGRGLVHVENDFHVFSPVMIPGGQGARLSAWALAPQIQLAASRMGLKRPLLWIHCPAGAALIGRIEAAGIVLQRTDRFEAFPESDPELVGRQIAELKQVADLVVYAAPHLQHDERHEVRRSLLVTHGVELDRFVTAGLAEDGEPDDMIDIARPRVGFIGGIDAHTFDPELFLDLARRMPDHEFVLVGGCSLPKDWCTLSNVHQLGRKPYDDIARYMAAMDVLIMPWNNSEWIKACNPIKLKEYLAVGRPVVTTDFPALEPLRGYVDVAQSAEGFAAAISTALQERRPRIDWNKRLRDETWDAKADLVRSALDRIYGGNKQSGSSRAA